MAGGGFEKPTNYSYGYIARVNGTDFYKAEKNSKQVKRELEGRLTLVEKTDDESVIEDKDNADRKGLTPKKFLLIGSNKDTGEVEVTGLVSLIENKHGGIKVHCKLDEKSGAIQNGYCDKAIFKKYSGQERETAPNFIKKVLKSKDGSKDVSIIGLSQEQGHLGIVWGSRKYKNSKSNDIAKWSRTGYLYQQQKSQRQQAWTSLGNSTQAKGFFVVHDLIFSEQGLNAKWKKKHEAHGNILGPEAKVVACKASSNCLKVIDIPLSTRRNYWIWDPAKTIIKNGELVTEDGVKLPFKLKLDSAWTSLLVK